MKWRLEHLVGSHVPLVGHSGMARVVRATPTSVDLLVGGVRTSLAWERIANAQERLVQNHELSVAELGGQNDAVALVSVIAFLQADEVLAAHETGVVRLARANGTPVRQPTAPRGGAEARAR
jgi:uncharacterized protein with ACT and thioredoxin-like domain